VPFAGIAKINQLAFKRTVMAWNIIFQIQKKKSQIILQRFGGEIIFSTLKEFRVNENHEMVIGSRFERATTIRPEKLRSLYNVQSRGIHRRCRPN
jgi:hypothetical protein